MTKRELSAASSPPLILGKSSNTGTYCHRQGKRRDCRKLRNATERGITSARAGCPFRSGRDRGLLVTPSHWYIPLWGGASWGRRGTCGGVLVWLGGGHVSVVDGRGSRRDIAALVPPSVGGCRVSVSRAAARRRRSSRRGAGRLSSPWRRVGCDGAPAALAVGGVR